MVRLAGFVREPSTLDVKGVQIAVVPRGSHTLTLPPDTQHLNINFDMRGFFAVAPKQVGKPVGSSKPNMDYPHSFSFLPACPKPQEIWFRRRNKSLHLAMPVRCFASRKWLHGGRHAILHANDPSLLTVGKLLLNKCETTKSWEDIEAVNQLLHLTFERLSRHIKSNEKRRQRNWPRPVRAAVALMQHRMEESLRLGDIAKEVGVSQYHFARMFRQTVGQSVRKYLTSLRVDRAVDLLSDSDVAISEIAYECGFASQSHMTTKVKELVGLTPGLIRLEARVSQQILKLDK